MSQQRERRRLYRRLENRRPHPLEGLAVQTHTCISAEGTFPVMVPAPGWNGGFQEFDRELCGRGVTRYVRPTLANEVPAGMLNVVKHILVEQLAPGVRRRRSFELHDRPAEPPRLAQGERAPAEATEPSTANPEAP